VTKNNYIIPALIATAIILLVFIILAGIVHYFLPVVPAIGYWQVIALNFFVGIGKFIFFPTNKKSNIK